MLTRRMQIQAIADRIAGLNGNGKQLALRDFQEPWRSCYRVVCEAPAGEAHMALVEYLRSQPNYEAILGAILAATPGACLAEVPSLAELAAELVPVDWLWRNWIPKGMITLLGAVPGAGKSYVALDLARRLIHQGTWPDGTPVRERRRNVVYVDAEAIPQVINERAMAWEMDRSRLFLMLPEPGDIIDLSLSVYRERLVEMMHQVEPGLVIVDSLSSISSKGENNVEDVRQLLAFLNALAADFACGLLLVHHLRKHNGLQLLDLTIDDFRGSGHIIAMARSVLALSVVQTGPEPDRNGPRKLEVVKTNLAVYPEPLGVEFLPLHPRGAFLKWGEAPVPWREPTKQESCEEWLLRTLEEAGGEMKPKELEELAEEAGYNRRMLYRVRDHLGNLIESTGRRNPNGVWRLRKSVKSDKSDRVTE